MVGWYVGAAINLVGSVSINLGTNLMKLGHNKRASLDLPEDQLPAVTRFREWQVGTFIFVCGNLANFVSFGFAAQSLLAALGSVQFVSNVFFASFVLKEKITFLVIAATACIIGGCLVLVVFGNHSSDDYTVEQLLALYRMPAYIVYLVMMFVFVFGSYILYLHGKHVQGQKGRENSVYVAILPVSYSIFSALLGTQSVLFSKSLSVLLRSTFTGSSQLGNWYFYVTLVCFLITAGFWVTRLNKGLRLFPAMIIVPLMQICWTLFSIVSGMIYFQEYTTFNPSVAKHGPLNAIMFVLGVLVVFVGVFLLTKSGSAQQPSPVEADIPQEELKAAGDSQEGQRDVSATPDGKPLLQSKAAQEVDLPPKNKIGMDTLRFTSLATSTNNNNLNSTMAKQQQQRRNALSAARTNGDTMSSSLQGSGHNTTMNTTVGHAEGGGNTGQPLATIESDDDKAGSMMGTLRKNAKKVQKHIKSDFNVDPEDFKQLFGLSKGNNYMPTSMYAMPGVDLMNTTHGRRKDGQKDTLFSDLPQSRFYGKVAGDLEAGERQGGSLDLDRQSAPLLVGPRSHSITLRESSPAPEPRRGSYSLGQSEGLPRLAEQQGLLREVMAKTIKQVEEAANRARSTVESKLEAIKNEQSQSYHSLHGNMGTEPEAAVQTPRAGVGGTAHSAALAEPLAPTPQEQQPRGPTAVEDLL